MNQLFSITFLHSYFTSNVLDGCQLQTDKNTQEMVNRFRLTTKMVDGTFSLYVDAGLDVVKTVQYLYAMLGDQPFIFYLVYRADEFFAITDVPLGWVGQLELSSKDILQKKSEDVSLTMSLRLSPRSIFKDNVIGVVKIYPEDLLTVSTTENIHYCVSFSARKAQWIYYVINRSQIKLKNPVITDQKNTKFIGPEEMVLSNGESALCFNSGDQLFAMKNNPGERFNLVDRLTPLMQADSRVVEHCLIKGLPTPKDDQMNIKKVDGSQHAFFAMHVYL